MRNRDFKKCFEVNKRRMATICIAAALALPAAFAQQGPVRSAGAVAPAIPYMGVGIMDVDDAHAKMLKMKESGGALITELAPGGPAEKAGLKVNDVVMEYDGQRVQGMEQLQRLIHESVPGRSIKVGVWRSGAMVSVDLSPELRRNMPVEVVVPRGVWGVDAPDFWPMGQFPTIDVPFMQTIMQNAVLGVACESLGDEQQFAEFFGVKDGLLVKQVVSNSAAARAGIKAGDVIVKVDETRVGTMRELNGALHGTHPKTSYQVTVVRNKKELPVTVQLP